MIKKILFILFIVLISNLIWEFAHSGLYIDLTGIQPTLHLILASIADVFIVLFLFIIISIDIKKKSFSFNWLKKPRKKDYFIFVVISVIFAFIWETINLSLGRWEYKPLMPTIFGIGLSPLLQLAFTGVFSLFISDNLTKKINNH